MKIVESPIVRYATTRVRVFNPCVRVFTPS